MKVIATGNVDDTGTFSACDLDQILERVDYRPTKAAIHFSIRKLIAKGLIQKLGIEKRRERNHVLISATELGKTLFEFKKSDPSYIESADELENI